MRVMPRLSFRGSAAVLALTTAALIGTAGAAFACHSDDTRPHPTPSSKPVTCDDLGKSSLGHGDVTFTGGEGEGRLNITKLNEGVKVTAIIVQGGGEGYNLYIPGDQGLGKTAPWNDLRAPLSRHGQGAKIDTWSLCGSKSETKPPTETTTTKPSTPTTTKPAETTTKAPSTSDTAVPPAGGQNGGSGGGLANTGFSNTWLIGVAALLLLAGGGLLALLKFRRRTN